MVEKKLKFMEEFTLIDALHSNVSNKTDKYYNIRNEYENHVHLTRIDIFDEELLLYFFSAPTHKHKQVMTFSSSGIQKASDHYVIILQYEEFFSNLDLDSLMTMDINEQSETITDLLYKINMKVWSNDASFYWQGFWEDLDSENSSVFPFRGKRGNKEWQDKHFQSGGLKKPTIRITKHITQILELMESFVPNILSEIQLSYNKTHKKNVVESSALRYWNNLNLLG